MYHIIMQYTVYIGGFKKQVKSMNLHMSLIFSVVFELLFDLHVFPSPPYILGIQLQSIQHYVYRVHN